MKQVFVLSKDDLKMLKDGDTFSLSLGGGIEIALQAELPRPYGRKANGTNGAADPKDKALVTTARHFRHGGYPCGIGKCKHVAPTSWKLGAHRRYDHPKGGK